MSQDIIYNEYEARARLEFLNKRFGLVHEQFGKLLDAHVFKKPTDSESESDRKRRFLGALTERGVLYWSTHENMEGSLYIESHGHVIRYRGSYENAHIYIDDDRNFMRASKDTVDIRRIDGKVMTGSIDWGKGVVPASSENALMDYNIWDMKKYSFLRDVKKIENEGVDLKPSLLDRVLKRKKARAPVPPGEEPLLNNLIVPIDRCIDSLEMVVRCLGNATSKMRELAQEPEFARTTEGPYR